MKRIVALLVAATASAAHAQHQHERERTATERRETHDAHAPALVLGTPMSRRASGTSWVADARG